MVELRAQLLRSRGFAVLKLDNRGSSRRGLAFEALLRLRMGTCELEDLAAGVAALVASGVADPARVGIYGWSYGGYVSALAANAVRVLRRHHRWLARRQLGRPRHALHLVLHGSAAV